MRSHEVKLRADAAKKDGQSFLAVCADTFDRIRGDTDGGYYYPTFGTAEELRSFLENKQLDIWNPDDARDICEAVVDLNDDNQTYQPSAWLICR